MDKILEYQQKGVTTLFFDFYDTVVHRMVHPNNVIRMLSKILIRELGLNVSIDKVYLTIKQSRRYLADELMTDRNEIHVSQLSNEIFIRLQNEGLLFVIEKNDFLTVFEEAQFIAECSVQYVNPIIKNTLQELKKNGGHLYLISDFYGSKNLIERLLNHHGLGSIFNDIFISSDVGKSKTTGSIYNHVLSELKIQPQKVLMIGDNEQSDIKNAKRHGIQALRSPHKKYRKKNKLAASGNDRKDLNKILKHVYKTSQKNDVLPYTEYVIFYHFFVERLYGLCKQKGVESLFFLSREGLFLKRLFDSYNTFNSLSGEKGIRTYYLRISRQAALQISLNPLNEEKFSYLRGRYNEVSVLDFLSFFNFAPEIKNRITDDIDENCEAYHSDFFDSTIFEKLIQTKSFQDAYEENRLLNKKIFQDYINSFGEDIKTSGINLVDVGWGGTMQEAIFEFFEKKIEVRGYYLGLNAVYNITEMTNRFGLNFSILPFQDYNFHILRANTQLYEQFASAGHGCTIAYRTGSNGFTIEHHEENEKWLYENYIEDHQNEMFEIHNKLLKNLMPVCYDDEMIDEAMVDLALKIGLLQSGKKIKFLETLSSGYYQNISKNKTGITYEIPKRLLRPKELVKFLIKPEQYFRFLVKLKAKIYKGSKFLSYLYPSYIVYCFYKLNRWFRYRVFKRYFL